MFSKNKLLLLTILITTTLVGIGFYKTSVNFGAPPYVDESENFQVPDIERDPYDSWVRPDGPIRIGLQVGHWKTSEMPQELERIKNAGGGTSGLGLAEWEVMLKVAEATKKILVIEGYEVDILPATVPVNYWADAFVSIHADGNLNPIVNGYKVASYARDRTGNALLLSSLIEKTYGEVSGLTLDPNITRNMTRYYAFNSRRYSHSIHPMTPGVLVETGFMTNYKEAQFLINKPEVSATGIANGIIEFINQTNPLKK